MRLPYIIAVAGFIFVGCRDSKPPPPFTGTSEAARIFREVQKVVPGVSAPVSENETLALLPAHFSDRNSEVKRQVLPPSSGEDLYLFPDRSYLYLEWADIMPATICDKGTWSFKDGIVSLQSDNSIPQQRFPKDKRYLALYHIVSEKRTLLLLGTDWHFSYFKQNATKNDDLMLFLCTFIYLEDIKPVRAETLRKKIYAESWRPEFFNKEEVR